MKQRKKQKKNKNKTFPHVCFVNFGFVQRNDAEMELEKYIQSG